MNSNQVGKFFTDHEGNVWQMQSFMERPSATFKKIGTDETMHGGVGCRLFEDFSEVTLEQDVVIRRLTKQFEVKPTHNIGDEEDLGEDTDEYTPEPCQHETLIAGKCTECGLEFETKSIDPKFGRRRF